MNEIRTITPRGDTATGAVVTPLTPGTARPRAVGLRQRWWAARERGAATAEYAIVIMAAVGFAGLLVVIMRSPEVRAILTDLVQGALTSGG